MAPLTAFHNIPMSLILFYQIQRGQVPQQDQPVLIFIPSMGQVERDHGQLHDKTETI
jgi:hypothetical protein